MSCEVKKIMYSFQQICIFFMVYAVIGWCVEVIYATTKHGTFVNRGFLNGPLCPIYGVGALIVILILTPISSNILILYAGSVLLASALEFLTGFVLEKIFNRKWWDYSHEPFNLMGYICLRFSLLWGAACVFIMKVIQPLVLQISGLIPQLAQHSVLGCFYTLFIADNIITVAALCSIHMRLRLSADIDRLLKLISDTVGLKLSDGTARSMKELREQRDRLDERYEHITAKARERYGDRYREATERLGVVHRRLAKAFPALELHKVSGLSERLSALREKFK